MNKKAKISIAFIVLVCVVGIAALISRPKKVYMEGDYIDQKKTVQELVSSSELIIIGKVKKVEPVKLHDLIFTDYEIEISEVLKATDKNFSRPVVVRVTGGTFGGIQQIAEGIKQINKNDTYLFALHRLWPDKSGDNLYTPMGALQGIMKIQDNGDKVKVEKFNDANVIETSVLGKELSKKSDLQ